MKDNKILKNGVWVSTPRGFGRLVATERHYLTVDLTVDGRSSIERFLTSECSW